MTMNGAATMNRANPGMLGQGPYLSTSTRIVGVALLTYSVLFPLMTANPLALGGVLIGQATFANFGLALLVYSGLMTGRHTRVYPLGIGIAIFGIVCYALFERLEHERPGRVRPVPDYSYYCVYPALFALGNIASKLFRKAKRADQAAYRVDPLLPLFFFYITAFQYVFHCSAILSGDPSLHYGDFRCRPPTGWSRTVDSSARRSYLSPHS